MVVCIETSDAMYYISDTTLEAVGNSIQRGDPLEIWWFSSYGKRFSEVMIFVEPVSRIRTESEAEEASF